MSYNLGTAHGKIDLDYEGGRAAEEAEEDIDGIGKSSEEADGKVRKFSEAMDSFTRFMARMSKVVAVSALGISSMVNAAQLLAGTLAALAPIVVASLGALPGIIASGVAALVVFRAATFRMGEALKSVTADTATFNEAIKDLTPEAQSFARAIRFATKELGPMQEAMENAFFSGLGPAVVSATQRVALLEAHTTGVAAAMGFLAKEVIRAGTSSKNIERLSYVLVGVNDFLLRIRGSLAPVINGFISLAEKASAFSGAVGDRVSQALISFGQSMSNFDLAGAFERAMVILRPLGDILSNLSSILGSLFANMETNAGGALAIVAALTGSLAEFLKTAEGQEAIRAFGEAMQTISGSVGQVFLTLLKELAPTLSELLPALAKLTVQLANVLVPAIQSAGPALAAMAKFMNDNMDVIGPLLIAMGALAVAVKAYAAYQVVANAATVAWTAIQKGAALATKAWAAAQTIMNIVMTANPIGLIIVAIAALVAAIVLIATKTDWFQRLWKVVWGAIKTAASAVADWFMNTLVPIFKAAWEDIMSVVQVVWGIIKGVLNLWISGFKFWWGIISGVLGFFSGLFKASFGLVVSIIKTAWAIVSAVFAVWKTVMTAIWKPIFDAVIGVFTWAWDTIRGVVTGFFNWITPYLRAAWEAITSSVKKAWEAITGTIERAWEFVKGITTTFFNWLAPYVETAINAVSSFLSAAWEIIKTAFTTTWEAVKNGFNTYWEAIKSIVQRAVDQVIGFINGIKEIVEKVRGFFNELKKAAEGGTGSLIEFVRGIPGRLLSALGDLASKAYNKGKEFVRGFINGIGSMVQAAINQVISLVNAVTDYLPGSPAKKGPLSGRGWTPHRGRSLVSGLAEGMQQGLDLVAKVSHQIATVATPVLPVAFGEASLSGILPAPVSAGSREGVAEAGSSITIQNLTIPVQGVWDFSDPGVARKIAFSIHTAIEDLKRGYK